MASQEAAAKRQSENGQKTNKNQPKNNQKKIK